MATLPSPSFLPTTAPAYALTTVFPPPPLGSGAPAYGHCTFPSAATYPSPHSPGGYPSYAFPFFTAPASQSHLSSPSNSPLQPLPVSTSSEFYGGQSLQAPPCGRSELQQHKDGGSDTEENGSGTAPYDCALQIENNGRDAHRVCPDSICQKGNSTYNTLFFDEKLGHKHTGPEILSVPSTGSNHSFVTQQAQTLSSLNLLHGELSKLSVLVSQFAVARGMETTEAPVTCSSRTVTPAQFKSPRTTASMFSGTCAAASSSASSRSSCDALATTYVKPHVLGEIPTPQSGYESYCYGHPNQIQSLQSSRVHCGSTNLGEQNQIQSLQVADYSQTRFHEILQYIASQSQAQRSRSQAQQQQQRPPPPRTRTANPAPPPVAPPMPPQPAQVPPTPPRMQAQEKGPVPVVPPGAVQPQPPSGPGAVASNGPLNTEEMAVDQSGPPTSNVPPHPTIPQDEETLIHEAIRLTRGRLRRRMAGSGPPSN